MIPAHTKVRVCLFLGRHTFTYGNRKFKSENQMVGARKIWAAIWSDAITHSFLFVPLILICFVPGRTPTVSDFIVNSMLNISSRVVCLSGKHPLSFKIRYLSFKKQKVPCKNHQMTNVFILLSSTWFLLCF